MPEEVLFSMEASLNREQIASHLRTTADKLDAGQPVTFQAGGESVTLDIPSRSTFEVKVEREGPADGPGELSVEFELEWAEDASAGGDLEIE